MDIKYLLKNREELWNVITHGGALLLGAGCLPMLILEANRSPKPFALVGVVIFGLAMLMVFAMSTLYHAQKDKEWKAFFHKLDHVAIFFLIAGTYTPFLLLHFELPWVAYYLGFIWSLALIGSIFKFFFPSRFNTLTTFLYLAMGWMVVLIGQPILQELSLISLIWLFIGGMGYSLGTIFYLKEKMKFSHAIWHVFVIVGSASHFIAVWSILY